MSAIRRYIDEQDIQQARNTAAIQFGPTGLDTFRRSYAEVRPDGFLEDWYEACARIVNGNCSFVPERYIEPGEPEKLYRYLLQMKILPGGRHIRFTGSRGGRAYIHNCHCADFTETFSEHFTHTFERLMEGGGVGANYSRRFVHSRNGNRPWVVRHPVELHLLVREDHPDLDTTITIEPYAVRRNLVPEHARRGVYGNETTLRLLHSRKYSPQWRGTNGNYLDIEDTREGWSTALRTLLEAFVSDQGRTGESVELVFDLSRIRPAGSILRSTGGTASGPGALALMLVQVAGVLNQRFPGEATPMDCMDIDHFIAACVVAGGSRRSARMAMKYWQDPDIFDFIHCKSHRDPEIPGVHHHHTTNISVVVDKKFFRAIQTGDAHALRVFEEAVDGMLTNGEPGFINASKHAEGEAPGTQFYSTNPCVTGDTWILTTQGAVPAAKLVQQPTQIAYQRRHYPIDGFFSSGRKQVFELVTEEGSVITATADHRVLVEGEDWKSLQELQPGDRVVITGDWSIDPEALESLASAIRERKDQLVDRTEDMYYLNLWTEDEQEPRRTKLVLNLLGIPSRLHYNGVTKTWWIHFSKTAWEQLNRLIAGRKRGHRVLLESPFWTETVLEVRKLGRREVYDCQVPGIHRYISNGFVSHNCGEIGFVRYPDMPAFDVCCLGHVNLAYCENDQELEEAFRLITRFLIRATFAPQASERVEAGVQRNRRIGVGFLGYHTWLALHGIRYSEAPETEWVRERLKRWYHVVSQTARSYASDLRIPEPIKKTAIAPTGTTGTLVGVSTGIQPVFAPYYIQRITYANHSPFLRRWRTFRQLQSVTDPEVLELFHTARQLDPTQLTLHIRTQPVAPEEQRRLLQPLWRWLDKETDPQDALELVLAAWEYNEEDAYSFLQLVRDTAKLHVEPSIASPDTNSVVEFLCEDMTTTLLRRYLRQQNPDLDEHQIENMIFDLMESEYSLPLQAFLANQKMVQQLFADNAISITINVRPGEISRQEVDQYILTYLPHIKGLTMYPAGAFPQSPREAIDQTRLQELLRLGYPIRRAGGEEQCTTGTCGSV